MAPPPTPHLIRLTFAPEYFGSILAWLFFGFVGMQFYTYTANRPNDTIWLKLLVYFVMLIVVTNLGIETYSGYAALVGGWGNEILLEKPPKPLILGPIFKAIVALCVQDFYAWRIWAFLQRTIAASLFCGVIVVLSILQVVGGIGIPASFFSVDVQSNLAQHTRIFNHLWLICGLVNDILITATMVFILRDARSHIMTHHTKTLLGRLIRLTVQTGAFTSLLAIATLALFLNESKIGLFQTFPPYLLEQSYALSLLCNLNINVNQTDTSTVPSGFYVQPSTLNFAHSKDYGTHPRNLKPERIVPEAYEFSLRSHHAGVSNLSDPNVAKGKSDEAVATDHDPSI